MNLLADTIKTKRMEQGMSAAALSRRIGKSSSYIAKVEAGSLEPSVKSFARISLALGFTNTETGYLIWMIACQDPHGETKR